MKLEQIICTHNKTFGGAMETVDVWLWCIRNDRYDIFKNCALPLHKRGDVATV